jgi:hypothetical protein
MQKAMLSARNVRRRPLLRLLVVASVVASAAVSGLASAGIASAEESTGATVVGRLLQAWPEEEHHGSAEAEGPLSWIQAPDGGSVRVPTDDVEGIPAGSTVAVTVGPQVNDSAAADGYDPARGVVSSQVVAPPAVAPALPAAGLTNEVTVVLVAPGGVAHDGVDLDEFVRTVDGPVADFWSEQSGGAIRMGVTGSHTWIDTAADCSDPTALWNEAAAAVHFVPGRSKHLLLYVSSAATDCSYALAQVGAAPTSGGMLYVRDTIPSVIAHEFGHNFGLGHSSGRQCDGAIEAGTCRTAAYRDYYDVMGASWSQLGSLNAPQAAHLGLIPAGQQQELSVWGSGASVTLSPLAGRTGVRALRLTDATGTDYWLEYRTAADRDAWLGTSANHFHLESGVLLHRAQALTTDVADTSLLFDGTPSAAAGWDRDLQASLPVGAGVPVSGGQFTVVVQSVSAAGAVVSVTPAPPAAAPAPAPAPAAPAPGAVMPGTSDPIGAATGPATDPATDPATAAAAPSASTFSAPPVHGIVHRSTPSLASVADTTTGGGFAVPLAGAVLAGSMLLALRRMRRSWARRE